MLTEEPIKWVKHVLDKYKGKDKEKPLEPGQVDPQAQQSPVVKKPYKPQKKWISAGGVVIPSMKDREHLYVIKPSNNYGPWTLPKGQVDPGETKEQAAKREVYEETGMHAKIIPGDSYLGTGKGSYSITHYWLMVKTGGSPRPTDETEEVKLLTWKQAKRLFRGAGNRRDLMIVQRAQEALKKIK